jgi:hypothetical protein
MMLIGAGLNISQVTSVTDEKTSLQSMADDWYYLPGFPNYSPSGLPDFYQKDQWDWTYRGRWTFCGPTALANIIWWFDSKLSNPDGTPGDGQDSCMLVQDFHAPGTPDPGPNSDDHNINNVNDGATPNTGHNTGELIERLAWYVNCNTYRFPVVPHKGTTCLGMWLGAKKWIRDAGLSRQFRVQLRFRPDFNDVYTHVRNNDGVLLSLYYYDTSAGEIYYKHWLTVAGVHPEGYLAVCDPFWDIDQHKPPGGDNDPSIVSHDIYEVGFDSPSMLAKWWLPEYPPFDSSGSLICWIIVISQIF